MRKLLVAFGIAMALTLGAVAPVVFPSVAQADCETCN
jgi:hypothetical protein